MKKKLILILSLIAGAMGTNHDLNARGFGGGGGGFHGGGGGGFHGGGAHAGGWHGGGAHGGHGGWHGGGRGRYGHGYGYGRGGYGRWGGYWGGPWGYWGWWWGLGVFWPAIGLYIAADTSAQASGSVVVVNNTGSPIRISSDSDEAEVNPRDRVQLDSNSCKYTIENLDTGKQMSYSSCAGRIALYENEESGE